MDMIYTLVVIMSLNDPSGLTLTDTLEVKGFPTLVTCEQALDAAVAARRSATDDGAKLAAICNVQYVESHEGA